MTSTRTTVVLVLLLAAASAAMAAPRYPKYRQYPANGIWSGPRVYAPNPYSPSGGYRSPVPNDTSNSFEYQQDMGSGSGRY